MTGTGKPEFDSVNVRDFGARGDGIAADTAAINAAFDENPDLARQRGGPEWFPGSCPKVFFPGGHGKITGRFWRYGFAPILVMLACSCAEVVAALAWKSTEQVVTLPNPVATSVSGTFAFCNTGTRPVRVSNTSEGCACLHGEAVTDKEVYAPGESGTLTLAIKAWRGAGRIERVFDIATDESTPTTTAIRLVCIAPAFLAAEPDWLFWRMGEAAKSKSIRLTADVKEPMRVLEVRTTANGFKHEFLTRTAEREYELNVVPDDTARDRRQRFTLVVARGDEPPFDLTLFATVLPRRQIMPGHPFKALLRDDRVWTAFLCLLGVSGALLLGWLVHRLGRTATPRRPESP